MITAYLMGVKWRPEGLRYIEIIDVAEGFSLPEFFLNKFIKAVEER